MVKRFAKSAVVALLLVFTMHAATQNSQELFLRANKEYKNKCYQKAAEIYESIEPKGRAVWYNLGNCLYHLDNTPQAIAYWRHSQKDAPFHEQEDAEHNIACAREKEGLSNPPSVWWHRALRASAALMPIGIAQLLFLFCWYLLFLLAWRTTNKGFKFFITAGLLVIIITWLAGILYVVYSRQCYPRAVVKHETAVVAGPHVKYHQVGVVRVPDELTVLQQRTGWCKIMHETTYGWVPQRALIMI